MRSALLQSALHFARGNTARIFLYHSVSHSPEDPLAVSPDVFAAQMAWLAASGLSVVSTLDLEEALRRRRPLSGLVAITFDDALRDFYTEAVPVLERLRLPATVFAPTSVLGGTSTWDPSAPHRPVLDRATLRDTIRRGFLVGGHGATHRPLDSLSDSALRLELDGSLAALRQLTASSHVPFAYPHGRGGVRERAAVRRAGYASAYMASGGGLGNAWHTDPFALGRDVVDAETSLETFGRLARGALDPQRVARSLRRSLHRSDPPLAAVARTRRPAAAHPRHGRTMTSWITR